MNSMSRRVFHAAIAVVCAAIACNSPSPVENEPAFLSASGSKSRFQVSPLSVDFGSTGTTASVTLSNSTGRELSWTASESAAWLSLEAAAGSLAPRSSRTISMSVQRGDLASGTYATDVTFSTSLGSHVVAVSMTVPAAAEKFDVTPLQVDFGIASTSASVTLRNNTAGSLSWTASENAGWLSLGAVSGTLAAGSSKTLTLFADLGGLTAGTYKTGLRISAGTAGADTVSVTATVPSTSPAKLAGQLIDQFDGHGLAGLIVQYDGATTTTDGSGWFTLPGDATSSLESLTISGAGVYERRTFARTGDDRWRVLPAGFDMVAYDDVARDEFGPGTVRWVDAPTVYIDSRPEGFSSDELSTWIAEVKSQVPTFIAEWTDGQLSPAAVIVTANPPNDFTDGTIVIHFSENSADYGGTASIGYARLSYLSNGAIDGAAVWLRYLAYSGPTKAGKRMGILGHELGHATGMGHMSGATESFMEPSLGTKTGLSPFDEDAASFHYTRSPENTSPDTDSSSSYLGMLAPSALPAIREWVCGAGEEEAGAERPRGAP